MTDTLDFVHFPADWDADRARLRRIELARGSVPSDEYRKLADKYERSIETIRGWMRGRSAGPRSALELNEEMLTKICQLRDVKAAWREFHADGTVTQQYHAFYRAWMRVEPGVRTGLLRGIKDARAVQLYATYPVGARLALSYGDATMADNYVTPNGGGTPFRPWHCFHMEAKTRYLWMAVVDSQPDAETQAALIADAILGRTLPDGTFVGGRFAALKVDRGADYMSKELADIMAGIGVPVYPCAPRSPWEKGPIEKVIQTYQKLFCTSIPGYVTEDDLGQRDPWHPADGRLLTFDEYVERAFEALRVYNEERPVEGLDWGTPLEAWRADNTAIERIRADSEASFATLFLRKDATRKVSKNGIRFRNRDYLDPQLLRFIGETLQIGFAHHDPSFLHVFRDGTWLMKLGVASDMTGVEGMAVKRARRKQIATIRRIQEAAATNRSASAPDRASSSKPVKREKPKAAPRRTQRGRSTLHRIFRPKGASK